MKNHDKTTKTESAKKHLVKAKISSVETKKVSGEIQQVSERLVRSLRDRANISRAITAAVNEDGFYVGIDLGDKKSNYCFLKDSTSLFLAGAE